MRNFVKRSESVIGSDIPLINVIVYRTFALLFKNPFSRNCANAINNFIGLHNTFIHYVPLNYPDSV